VRFLTPACAGAGSCPPRGSSRATGWPGVSRDWAPLRYTWEHDRDRYRFKQPNSIILHGYVSARPARIMRHYQSLNNGESRKLRLERTKQSSPQKGMFLAGALIFQNAVICLLTKAREVP
jgi:hypothetical protein